MNKEKVGGAILDGMRQQLRVVRKDGTSPKMLYFSGYRAGREYRGTITRTAAVLMWR